MRITEQPSTTARAVSPDSAEEPSDPTSRGSPVSEFMPGATCLEPCPRVDGFNTPGGAEYEPAKRVTL